MDKKDALIKLKKIFEQTKTISLEDKVDEFIEWYSNNIVEGNYTSSGEYYMPIEMRNFIEKMAVWYELKYPDYKINEELVSNQKENNNIDWIESDSTKEFIELLSNREKNLLLKPKYSDIVYLDSERVGAHLLLTNDGYVEECRHMNEICKEAEISEEEIICKHIKEVVNILKSKDKLPKGNGFEKEIIDYENRIYQNDEMLNCVMYRLIERNPSRYGPRRAFMFAKEYGRNIDIPMIYGVNVGDPNLIHFINEYINAGGSKNLKCYVGYELRESKYQKLPTISIQELIMPHSENYTNQSKNEDKTKKLN